MVEQSYRYRGLKNKSELGSSLLPGMVVHSLKEMEDVAVELYVSPAPGELRYFPYLAVLVSITITVTSLLPISAILPSTFHLTLLISQCGRYTRCVRAY